MPDTLSYYGRLLCVLGNSDAFDIASRWSLKYLAKFWVFQVPDIIWVKDLYFDDSFTGGGGFGDIFGPNLNIPGCQAIVWCSYCDNFGPLLNPTLLYSSNLSQKHVNFDLVKSTDGSE